jgi:hypothetical protein
MANCVTCGRELHPERAEKYDYCTDPQCQRENAKGLTILALGVNKAADHYQVLDERTRDRVASGEWVEEAASGKELAARKASRPPRDQQRPQPRAGARGAAPGQRDRRGRAPAPTRRDQWLQAAHGGRAGSGAAARPRWTKAQQDLALLYNQRGMRPDEIAARLRLDRYTVTQMILSGQGRAKP